VCCSFLDLILPTIQPKLWRAVSAFAILSQGPVEIDRGDSTLCFNELQRQVKNITDGVVSEADGTGWVAQIYLMITYG